MAYASDNLDEDNNQQATQQRLAQTSDPSAPPSTGGGSSGLFGNAPSGGAETSGQSGAVKSNSSNSGWTNLDSYLNANQDQAAGEGAKIAGNVDQTAQNAQKQVSDLANNWNNEVQSGTVNADPNAVQQAITDATSAKAGQTNANWNQDVQNFKNQASANYGGPTDFTTQSGYGAASGATSGAANDVNALGSEAGREGLLHNAYQDASKNGYTQGEGALDNALVQGNKSAQQAMSGTQQKWSGLDNILGAAATQGDEAAQKAIHTDQQTSQAANSALGSFGDTAQAGTGAAGTFAGQIAKQTSDAQNNYTTSNANILSDINSGKFTDADYKALGLTGDTHTYGITPTQLASYVHAGINPTTANTATADQYAQAQALQALISGTGNPGAFGSNPLNPSDASQAGTAGPAYTIDNAGLQGGLAKAQSNAQTAIDNYIAQDYNSFGPTASGGAPAPQFTTSNFQTELPQWQQQEFQNLANSNDYPWILNAASNIMQHNADLSNLDNQLNSTFGNYSGAPAMAYGGVVKQPTLKTVAAPVKQPHAPKLLNPASKLPGMPHFDEGGEVGPQNLLKNTDPEARAQIAKVFGGEPVGTGGASSDSTGKTSNAKSGSLWDGIKAAIGLSDANAQSYQAGGKVPGQPKVNHDNYANDTVDAKLTPGEVVMDLNTLRRGDAIGKEARDVAQAIGKRNSKKEKAQ